jgi:arylsulfatase
MDTPFQWAKQVASHFGGTRNGFVISWPARNKDKGGIRTSQQRHRHLPNHPRGRWCAITIMLNGVPQKPVEGFSMVYSFDDAKAKSVHRTQYFEMLGNRAIYNDGWVAATTPAILPWVVGATSVSVEDYKWELYNVEKDFSEANDLAAQEPKKLRQLQDLFFAEAGKYNVLPIDNSKIERFDVNLRPSLTRGRTEFTYYPGMVRIPEGSAPDFKNKSHRITADVDIPAGGAEGMLLTQGGRFNGLGLYLLKGKPVFYYNLVGVERTSIDGKETLAPGKHSIELSFK